MGKQEKFKNIIKELKDLGVFNIAVFGSYARNEETDKSDIDLLVSFKDIQSLMDLVRIQLALEEKIGTSVDLLTEDDLSSYLKDQIHQEKIMLYE